MENIVRYVTKSFVYSVGNPMPVPEGYTVDPFIISQIKWDGEDTVELICTPDEEAANEPFDQNADIPAYNLMAKQAVADNLVILAVVTDDKRVEFLMTKMDLEASEAEAEAEEQAEQAEQVEQVEQAKLQQPQAEPDKTEPAPQPSAPSEQSQPSQ